MRFWYHVTQSESLKRAQERLLGKVQTICSRDSSFGDGSYYGTTMKAATAVKRSWSEPMRHTIREERWSYSRPLNPEVCESQMFDT